jgi:hypothetical protein
VRLARPQSQPTSDRVNGALGPFRPSGWGKRAPLRTVGLKDPRAFPPQPPSEALGSSLRLDALAGPGVPYGAPTRGCDYGQRRPRPWACQSATPRTRPGALRTSAARPRRVRLVVVFIARYLSAARAAVRHVWLSGHPCGVTTRTSPTRAAVTGSGCSPYGRAAKVHDCPARKHR